MTKSIYFIKKELAEENLSAEKDLREEYYIYIAKLKDDFLVPMQSIGTRKTRLYSTAPVVRVGWDCFLEWTRSYLLFESISCN